MTKEAHYEQLDYAKSHGVSPEQATNDLINMGYEIEGVNATFDLGEAVNNFPGDVVEIGTQIYEGMTSPIQTMTALSSVGRGGIRKLSESVFGEEIAQAMSDFQTSMPGGLKTIGDKYDKETFDAVIDLFHEQYGSKDKILNTIEKRPAQFLSDLSIVLNPASAALKTSLAGTRFAKGGQVVNRLVRALEPTQALGEISGGMLRKFFSKTKWQEMMGATDAQIEKISKGTRIYPENAIEWLMNHGIAPTHGLRKMSEQLDNIKILTRQKLDNILSIVPDKFKHRNTRVLLDRIKKHYSKEGADIVSGIDELKILDKSGKPITKDIPYKQKESIFIPKEDLSDITLERIDRIKELSAKAPDGFTLSEMNEIKRLGDDIFNIYDPKGEPKIAEASRELDRLRKSTRKYIEDTADGVSGQYGDNLKDVAKLNQQVQYAKGWKEITDKTTLVGAKRNSVLVSIIGAGAFYSAVYGDFAGVASGVAAIGVLQASRIPKIRSFVLTKLGIMGGKEYKILLGDVKHFRKTQKVGMALRKLRRDIWKYGRYTGIIGEQKIDPYPEKQALPEFQTTQQDEVIQ